MYADNITNAMKIAISLN
ncbi:MAG: hypothetical protein Q8764_02275 [Pigeon pea little leaf phytoplasma]|uniref:Uncharacterized protein n=1 Tax=Candidatus Phytoplasma fabacearum TaxID=2982628 RepID=A0ABU8ZTS7_9MOLU|nr:hypothetical protein ['Bituminaria bituminosa' little leaf phytoplasma]MDV3158831.1 hypothetical protein [Pigeon pea little leaf phytoplasma]MDO8024122.1 hypothetical protein ['Bituminaria bituminosa' little leaf phytoplasma]MDO8030811.1 hypothetical protein ['Bituminaria bituminosa' little leaf phytoplasma]MDV3161694.1 hypothetical protein [Pigeon pea little leaf phytoplasma]